MYDVRRVLGITRGGDAALMAVAHLTGGDYDMGGADNVGEVLALGAVRQLLLGCEVRGVYVFGEGERHAMLRLLQLVVWVL
jgi:fructose-1,6-bisphosphatase/sedoheptulose 1,7-bisphosphatase-like protein